MVKFAVTDMETAITRGKEASALLTTRFQPPIRLEFEKVFWPFLLISYVWVSVHVGPDGVDMCEKLGKSQIGLCSVTIPAARDTVGECVGLG